MAGLRLFEVAVKDIVSGEMGSADRKIRANRPVSMRKPFWDASAWDPVGTTVCLFLRVERSPTTVKKGKLEERWLLNLVCRRLLSGPNPPMHVRIEYWRLSHSLSKRFFGATSSIAPEEDPLFRSDGKAYRNSAFERAIHETGYESFFQYEDFFHLITNSK
jgi:hypothetical protein